MKTNFFANENSYSCTRDSADVGASAICIAIPSKMLPKRASCVLGACSNIASWIRIIHRSIECPPKHLARRVPRVFFFLPLIPDRPVNEIDAAGAGQVNYAGLSPPRISSRSANGRPLAMRIGRRERRTRDTSRRTRCLFSLRRSQQSRDKCK